jgi:LemA protein
VLNQYQRRADLVPNLVATVKGEANFEQDTLTKVVEARAKATSMQVTPETLNNPEAFQKFQQAQGELSARARGLMVVSERYPDLKANQGFRDLRVQLEGTENRITVARNRYIQTVQEYNVLARSFPTNLTAMVFGYQPKPSFTVQNEAQISTPPRSTSARPRSKPRGVKRLLALVLAGLCWLCRAGAGAGRAAGPAAVGARHRPDRHARRDPAPGPGRQARRVREAKGTQIVVLMVPTTQPEDIASYANRVANAWKIGRKATSATASWWWSPRTTARCASRSPRRWKARCPTWPPAASSTRR